MGLAVDAAGNLYEQDFNDIIYKFTPQGVRSTFASGLALDGLRFEETNILFDAQGNLWVPSTLGNCDTGPCQIKIYQITPQGVVGILTLPTTGYNTPEAIALDNSGNLWVTLLTPTFTHEELHEYVGAVGNPLVIVPNDHSMNGLITDTAGNVYVGYFGAAIRKALEGCRDLCPLIE